MTIHTVYRNSINRFLPPLVWAILLLICAVYGVFSFYMGGLEIVSSLGIVEDAPHRAAPFVFLVHVLSGGVALISAPLQLNRRILTKKRKLHRGIGRTYVGS